MKILLFMGAAVFVLAACDAIDDGEAGGSGAQAGADGGAAKGGSSAQGGSAAVSGASGSGGQVAAGSGGQPNAGGGGIAGGGGTAGGGGGSAGSGGGEAGSAGAGGVPSVDAPCTIESMHIEVSGGMAFERSAESDDSCSASFGGDEQQISIAFVIAPPGQETKPLFSFVAEGVASGTEGAFTPEIFSVLAYQAIWSKDMPAPDSVLCSVNLTTFDELATTLWRLAGSVSCPSALSGIGVNGGTPLTIEDWSFSILVDTSE
jgi:hypothetical protein